MIFFQKKSFKNDIKLLIVSLERTANRLQFEATEDSLKLSYHVCIYITRLRLCIQSNKSRIALEEVLKSVKLELVIYDSFLNLNRDDDRREILIDIADHIAITLGVEPYIPDADKHLEWLQQFKK